MKLTNNNINIFYGFMIGVTVGIVFMIMPAFIAKVKGEKPVVNAYKEMYKYSSERESQLNMACIQKRVFLNNELKESNGVCCALPEIFDKECGKYMPK